MLDENWLRSRLRMAMDIESRDGVTEIADGVWRLGDARREPVLLSRSLARLERVNLQTLKLMQQLVKALQQPPKP